MSNLSFLSVLALTGGVINVLISLFVAASTVALSVSERASTCALLRAVGATPGQVRRTVMAELAVLGALASLGYLLGVWLASFTVRGFAAHQVVPASTRPWSSPVEILPATAAAIVIAEISGFLAARRASRIRPAAALGEATTERRSPGLLRLLLGAAALVGAVVLAIDVVRQAKHLPAGIRGARRAPGIPGRHRVPGLPAHPGGTRPAPPASRTRRDRAARQRRATDPVPPHGHRRGSHRPARRLPRLRHHHQRHDRPRIGHPVQPAAGRRRRSIRTRTRPRPLGTARDQAAARRQRRGRGSAPTTVYLVQGGAAESTMAEALTPGPLPALLRLAVTSGSLQDFGPGDIALSQLAAGQARGASPSARPSPPTWPTAHRTGRE